MDTQEDSWSSGLDPSVGRMIEATNAEDTEAFIATFAEDAVVDDFGRRFVGRDEISAWSDNEHIGTHNRIEVMGVSRNDEGVVLDIRVSGDGYNGGGTFAIQSHGGEIQRMIIRG